MKKLIPILLFTAAATFSSSSFAGNQGGGKGKQQTGEHSQIMNDDAMSKHGDKMQKWGSDDAEQYKKNKEKKRMDDNDDYGDRDRDRDQLREHQEDAQGMEKQREMKMEQEQKELGKGSEQGQESREQRKKWYRFWE